MTSAAHHGASKESETFPPSTEQTLDCAPDAQCRGYDPSQLQLTHRPAAASIERRALLRTHPESSRCLVPPDTRGVGPPQCKGHSAAQGKRCATSGKRWHKLR